MFDKKMRGFPNIIRRVLGISVWECIYTTESMGRDAYVQPNVKQKVKNTFTILFSNLVYFDPTGLIHYDFLI